MLFEIETTRAGLDLMQRTGPIVAEYDTTQMHLRPVGILVDSFRLASGIGERLWELKLPARRINASESPSVKGTQVYLRAKRWFASKQWLEQRGCKLVR